MVVYMDKNSILDNNLYESFRRVKSDVMQLSNEVHKIADALSKSFQEQEKVNKYSVVMSQNVNSIADSLKILASAHKAVAQKQNNLDNELKNLVISLNQAINRIEKLEKVNVKTKKVSSTKKKVVKSNPKIKKANTNSVKKVITKPKVQVKKVKQKKYIASKTGKKFHLKNCVFAKNIKPKSMIKYSTKEAYLNNGYKPCDCLKRI
jgi:hypothetical protein